ncbi:hypothetical protein C8J57DRAFT_1213101 [Mycena rebaudengoi]|nr:hypothetical protein C8J57DRAFT_1213101 [Mycena rebaudengoi]
MSNVISSIAFERRPSPFAVTWCSEQGSRALRCTRHAYTSQARRNAVGGTIACTVGRVGRHDRLALGWCIVTQESKEHSQTPAGAAQCVTGPRALSPKKSYIWYQSSAANMKYASDSSMWKLSYAYQGILTDPQQPLSINPHSCWLPIQTATVVAGDKQLRHVIPQTAGVLHQLGDAWCTAGGD